MKSTRPHQTSQHHCQLLYKQVKKEVKTIGNHASGPMWMPLSIQQAWQDPSIQQGMGVALLTSRAHLV